MIYTFGDDIPLLSQWIKKSKSEDLDFWVEMMGVDGLCPSFALRTPDCVRRRRGGSTPLYNTQTKNNSPTRRLNYYFGGDDGSRTHVRKSIPETFYERSLSFEISSEERRQTGFDPW